MRAQPQLQVVDSQNGVVEYTVTTAAGWLSVGWLDALIATRLVYAYFSDSQSSRSWPYLLCPVLLWYIARWSTYRQESLLVIEAVGVQLSSQDVMKVAFPGCTEMLLPVSGKGKLFIPASSIQEVVLLEGIQGWSVIWYLAIAQKEADATRLHVIFKHALPRLAILREVRHGARKTMKMRSHSGQA